MISNNCSGLLELLENKEKLFAGNYLLLTGKVFPYFLFQHIKKNIAKNKNIKEWVVGSDYFLENNVISFEDNIFFYIPTPEMTIGDLSQSFGVEMSVFDESSLAIFKKNFSVIKNNKTIFFLIFIEEKWTKLFPDELFFKVDDILTYSTALVFEKYVLNQFDKTFSSLLSYILKIVMHERPEFASIEFLFFLTRHAICLKKADVKDFVITEINDKTYPLLINYSMFDLLTLLFQGRYYECFVLWNKVKHFHPPEFWLYFLMNQVWYAFLFVESKQSASEKTYDFFKKVNKWFMVSGEKKSPFFNKKKLKDTFLFLYQVEMNAKIYETNLLADLTSFFLLFLK